MNEKERQEFLMDMRESMKLEAEVSEMFNDPVRSPKHYQSEDGIEAIDVIKAFVPDPHSYYMGNVLKYVMRHLQKNGKQDLEKARWYLDEMIEEYDA